MGIDGILNTIKKVKSAITPPYNFTQYTKKI